MGVIDPDRPASQVNAWISTSSPVVSMNPGSSWRATAWDTASLGEAKSDWWTSRPPTTKPRAVEVP